MMRYLFALLVLCGTLSAQSALDTCGLEGSAVRSDARVLNRKKNRSDLPSDAQINRSVDFATLLVAGATPRDFREGDAVEITAYVADVKLGAVETVNCKATDDDHRDVHIELTVDPMSNEKSGILIAEVTPRVRRIMAQNKVDWSFRKIRDTYLGRWVKLRGWAFYDAMHDDESFGSGGSRIWRGSAWEVHPITALSVTTRPANLVVPRRASTTQAEPAPASPSVAEHQCEAITKAGKRCSRSVKPPDRYCWQHRR